jgi:hypothetical protein
MSLGGRRLVARPRLMFKTTATIRAPAVATGFSPRHNGPRLPFTPQAGRNFGEIRLLHSSGPQSKSGRNYFYLIRQRHRGTWDHQFDCSDTGRHGRGGQHRQVKVCYGMTPVGSTKASASGTWAPVECHPRLHSEGHERSRQHHLDVVCVVGRAGGHCDPSGAPKITWVSPDSGTVSPMRTA